MAELFPCQTCGHLVDKNAPYCPNCGRPAPAIVPASILTTILIFVFIFIIFGIIVSYLFLGDVQTDSSSNNKHTINAVEKTDSENKDAINAYKDPCSQNEVVVEVIN